MKVERKPALFEAARVATVAAALLLAIGAVNAASAAGSPASAVGVVNVNTATAEELQLLPGVGKSRAAAILEARKSRGGFKSVEDLLDVKGIGPAMLERMRPSVTLTGRTTARPATKAPTRTTRGDAARGD